AKRCCPDNSAAATICAENRPAPPASATGSHPAKKRTDTRASHHKSPRNRSRDAHFPAAFQTAAEEHSTRMDWQHHPTSKRPAEPPDSSSSLRSDKSDTTCVAARNKTPAARL